MILEKDKDGWWTYKHDWLESRSDFSDLDAVVNAHCCGLAVELERIPEPLADEVYAALARNRNCNNCNCLCTDAGKNADRGCSDWTRK